MLRVDTRPRKRNAPRPAWKVQLAFHQWLRGRPCACGGRNPDCRGKIQAAHGPDPATKGIATKSDDRIAMPLSEGCHLGTQHRIGWPAFAKQFLQGADPREMCLAYFKAWPGDKGDLA
jgi:hypothetical protein